MNKLRAMQEAGKRIIAVKEKITPKIKAGTTSKEINDLADNLISQTGNRSSFKTVKDYDYTTCINVNQGMVHGPPNRIPFKPADIVTVDLGLIHQGFHVDTAFTIQIPPLDEKTTYFLNVGKKALRKAIKKAVVGNTIYQISEAMQKSIESASFSAIRDLTGHGIGKSLHESPNIPCYTDPKYKKEVLKEDQTLAIEVMYSMGKPDLVLDSDGWTYKTTDNSIAGMFEDTVYISKDGPIILTS